MTAVHFTSSREMDAAFRHVVDAHSPARLDGPVPEPHTPLALVAGLAGEAAATAVELVESAHLVVHAGATMPAAVSALLTVGPPAAALVAGLAEIDHAWEEHARRGTEVDAHQMRGALLYTLGRIPHPDRPEAVAQFGTHERDGARDAARFERLRPHAFAQLQARVLTHFREGERASLLGSGDPDQLVTRLREDPIFRMGYEETRALRESDPDAFEARAREARALSQAVEDGRSGAPVRG